MKRLGGTGDLGFERQAWNISTLVGHVPPLRGFFPDAYMVPPLPRWATLFRPWRDWLSGGWPSTNLLHEGRNFKVSRTSLFRPYRDRLSEGWPPTVQFSELGPSR